MRTLTHHEQFCKLCGVHDLIKTMLSMGYSPQSVVIPLTSVMRDLQLVLDAMQGKPIEPEKKT